MSDRDLQSWAKEKKIWLVESWREYLQQLIEVYSLAKMFKEFHIWLFNTFSGRSIRSLPENLKDSARMCLSGGGLEKNAFGRLMFDKFGLGVEYCDTYEKSLEEYRKYGDSVKMSVVNIVLGIEDYDEFLKLFKTVIDHLANVIGVEFKEPEINEDFAKWVKYPDPELPRKIEYFLNKLASMHEFANYYTMFVKHFETAPLVLLANFLDCDAQGIRNLAMLWRIKYIYDNKMNIVSSDEINDDNIYELFWFSHFRPPPPSISISILKLFGYKGYAQRMIENFVDISNQIEEFLDNCIKSLRELKKSGQWKLNDVIRTYLEAMGKLELDGEVPSLLITVSSDGTIQSIRIEKLYHQRWIIASVSSYGLHYEYKFEESITPSNVLEQLFPLLATGFLDITDWDDEKRTIRLEFTGVCLDKVLEVLSK